jgi:8-hydroxy-5-deazaflavin:NADPH oxidoreductase
MTDDGVRAGDVSDALSSDVVVLAFWYPGTTDFAREHAADLEGKVVVDISNPLDESWIRLGIDPSTSSARRPTDEPSQSTRTHTGRGEPGRAPSQRRSPPSPATSR